MLASISDSALSIFSLAEVAWGPAAAAAAGLVVAAAVGWGSAVGPAAAVG